MPRVAELVWGLLALNACQARPSSHDGAARAAGGRPAALASCGLNQGSIASIVSPSGPISMARAPSGYVESVAFVRAEGREQSRVFVQALRPRLPMIRAGDRVTWTEAASDPPGTPISAWTWDGPTKLALMQATVADLSQLLLDSLLVPVVAFDFSGEAVDCNVRGPTVVGAIDACLPLHTSCDRSEAVMFCSNARSPEEARRVRSARRCFERAESACDLRRLWGRPAILESFSCGGTRIMVASSEDTLNRHAAECLRDFCGASPPHDPSVGGLSPIARFYPGRTEQRGCGRYAVDYSGLGVTGVLSRDDSGGVAVTSASFADGQPATRCLATFSSGQTGSTAPSTDGLFNSTLTDVSVGVSEDGVRLFARRDQGRRDDIVIDADGARYATDPDEAR